MSLVDCTRIVFTKDERHDQSAVEAFLANEDAIEEIRSEAREEARARATECGLDDVLEDDETRSVETPSIDTGTESR